jgi:hypothetical protein
VPEDQLFDHVVTKISIEHLIEKLLFKYTLDQSCLITDCLLAILCIIISSSSVDKGNASSADISSVTTTWDVGRAKKIFYIKNKNR